MPGAGAALRPTTGCGGEADGSADAPPAGPPLTQPVAALAGVEAIARELESAPLWARIGRGDTRSLNRLLVALARVAASDPDAVRHAIELYLHGPGAGDSDRTGRDSNVYVLDRLMFDVPCLDRDAFRGSWHRGGRYEILWPLVQTPDGLALTGHAGPYFGVPFMPMQEFDAFRAIYGVRSYRLIALHPLKP